MRSQTVLTALALAASTLVLAQPASARPALDRDAHDRAGKLDCQTAVVGVDSTRHLTFDVIKNGHVSTSTRSKKKLGFDVTAVGFYDSDDRRIRLDAVTDQGTPRQISGTLSQRGKVALSGSKKYAQSGFSPRLFADNFGYYAYTVDNKGKLARWVLTRYSNGSIKFARKTVLGSGFDDLTSLQASDVYKIKGVDREVLYATTSAGALEQIVVPIKKPGNYKVRRLADTGYAGVTEISWTYCNNHGDFHALVTIDGAAATATWTTIRDALTKPKTVLKGEVSGSKGWDLVGAI